MSILNNTLKLLKSITASKEASEGQRSNGKTAVLSGSERQSEEYVATEVKPAEDQQPKEKSAPVHEPSVPLKPKNPLEVMALNSKLNMPTQPQVGTPITAPEAPISTTSAQVHVASKTSNIEMIEEPLDWPCLALRIQLREEAEDLADKVMRMIDDAEACRCSLIMPPPGESFMMLDVLDQEQVWFVGDIHGELLGFEEVLRFIDLRRSGKHLIIFLGDFIDDGPYSYEVLLRLFRLILERKPGQRLCILAGNHDEGLEYREGGVFIGTVEPDDFARQLNNPDNGAGGLKDNPTARSVAQTAIKLFNRVPRAILLPNGLLAAHGGVPHTDCVATLKKILQEDGKTKALSYLKTNPQCRQDFVWTRAHERAPRKIPNRESKGCQYGIKDFSDFCETASQIVDDGRGWSVTKFIRGHDHFPERYRIYKNYNNNVLTINNMCCRMPREYEGGYACNPAVVSWVPTGDLKIHRLHILEDVIKACYPPSMPSPSQESQKQTDAMTVKLAPASTETSTEGTAPSTSNPAPMAHADTKVSDPEASRTSS